VAAAGAICSWPWRLYLAIASPSTRRCRSNMRRPSPSTRHTMTTPCGRAMNHENEKFPLPLPQAAEQHEAVFAEKVAQYFNAIQPANSSWRPGLTAADAHTLDPQECFGRRKVSNGGTMRVVEPVCSDEPFVCAVRFPASMCLDVERQLEACTMLRCCNGEEPHKQHLNLTAAHPDAPRISKSLR